MIFWVFNKFLVLKCHFLGHKYWHFSFETFYISLQQYLAFEKVFKIWIILRKVEILGLLEKNVKNIKIYLLFFWTCITCRWFISNTEVFKRCSIYKKYLLYNVLWLGGVNYTGSTNFDRYLLGHNCYKRVGGLGTRVNLFYVYC